MYGWTKDQSRLTRRANAAMSASEIMGTLTAAILIMTLVLTSNLNEAFPPGSIVPRIIDTTRQAAIRIIALSFLAFIAAGSCFIAGLIREKRLRQSMDQD